MKLNLLKLSNGEKLFKGKDLKMSRLHTFIQKTGTVTKIITRAQAIREKCYDCSCFNKAETKRCPVETCALWVYRPNSGYKEVSGRKGNLDALKKADSARRTRVPAE
jgi:hypothetical protein